MDWDGLRRRLEGCYITVPTMFGDPDLALDLARIRRHVGWLRSRGIAAGNAVLLGSASFWEGVDVAGDALSVVVIDKLPFAPPDDPLLAARLKQLKDDGGNPFRDWQLPQAAIALKQGAGRLIRTETDRGVLMIGDPRLVDKPYGKTLWRSLPPMKRPREVDEVRAFFGVRRQLAVDGRGGDSSGGARSAADRFPPLGRPRSMRGHRRLRRHCQLPTGA